MTPDLLAELIRRLVGDVHRDALFAARVLVGVDFDSLRAAARSSGFDSTVCAQSLLRTLASAHERRMAALRQEDERFREQIESCQAGSEEYKALLRAVLEGEDETVAERVQEELLEIEVAAGLALSAIGPKLSRSPESLRNALRDRAQSFHAYHALEELGAAGAAFGEDLLDHLATRPFDSILRRAGVSVFRHHPALIRKLLDRFWAVPAPRPYPEMISRVIHDLGAACAAVDPGLGEKLLAGTRSSDTHTVVACVVALGGVTRGSDLAIARLIELTAHPAQIVQGVAIDALGSVACRPEVVVPHLGRLLDTFVEYDCDMGYSGPDARIAHALAEYREAAAQVMPAILARIQPATARRASEPGSGILQLLAAIGPAAHEALPLLEAWQRRLAGEGDESPDDDLSVAIRSIRGDTGRVDR